MGYMADSGRVAAPTIRRTWSAVVAILLVVVLGLGALAAIATQYQRTAFDDITAELEMRAATNVELERSVDAVVGTVGFAIYLPPESLTFEQRWAEYDEAASELTSSISLAADVYPDEGSPLATLFDTLRSRWVEVDEAVRIVPEMWAEGELSHGDFATGFDPFEETVWTPLGELRGLLTDMSSENVTNLSARASNVDRVQRVIPPIVAAAVTVALALALWGARRMRRRVIEPIIELRAAANEIGRGRGAEPIVVDDACAELRELADTLNRSAIAIASSHEALWDQAHTDSLTSLPNRKAFIEDVVACLESPSAGVGVLFVDLDDFKVVNDSLGHAAGDHLLRVIAQRLTSTVRGGELVARLGGDEFAIRIGGLDSPAAAVAVSERVLAALAEPVVIEGVPCEVSCSIGIAVSRLFGGVDDVDELMRNADFAMYIAKSQGKNRFEMFASSMHEAMLTRTELSRDLARAVELDQMELHYQPIVDLSSLDVLGFEALVRWRHPGRGMLAPGEFIDLAESTGEIVAIGAWVIDRACADLAALAAPRRDGPPPWMSVNVSASQLDEPLVDVVRLALERHGVEADHLVLEITEAVALASASKAHDVLASLRHLGVHVALDDFGVGFSSLRQLQELPVDVIKIDRAFVSGASSLTRPMLEAIVALGTTLGLDIIAEGIEEREELQRLRDIGAVAGQGYLFARPAPRHELEARRDERVTLDG